jgi:hypothetical protein
VWKVMCNLISSVFWTPPPLRFGNEW